MNNGTQCLGKKAGVVAHLEALHSRLFHGYVNSNVTKCVFNIALLDSAHFNLLNPTSYMMHQQFNIQQLYALPTMYLRVLYLSKNKQRLVPLT
jgi:hypothetical protein